MEEMRLQDYLDRLTDEDREEFFATVEKDEKKLRKFLSRFEEKQLIAIAEFMNDPFNMPADDMDLTDFIVTLYKCQKADFYYEDVIELIEDINTFAFDSEDSF